jgi:hypothetical protein
LPLGRRQIGQQLLVGRGGAGLGVAQRPGALWAEPDGVGSGIFLGAAALDQPSAKQPGDNVGQG